MAVGTEPVTTFQAIVFGIVQGLTEFLPISSTAHLRILPELLGRRTDPGAAFTAVIQLGTVAAVLIYFAKDLWAAFRGWVGWFFGKRNTPEARMGWGVFWGTIPIVVIGFLFKDWIKSEQVRSLYVVATMLIVMGLVMLAAERSGRKTRKLRDVKVQDGILVGLWQCIALIPGASRSGSTISGALFAGFDRPTAARFSFLLSVPSITAAGIYELIDEKEHIVGDNLLPAIIATVVSFVVGYASIAWLIKFLQKKGVGVFVWYRIALGIALIVGIQAGWLRAQAVNPEEAAEPPVEQAVVPATPADRIAIWEDAMRPQNAPLPN